MATANNFMYYLAAVPGIIQEKTMNMADTLAGKIDEYRRAMKGESDNDETNKGDQIVSMEKARVDMLHKIRLSNPHLYCLMVKLSDCINVKAPPSTYLKVCSSTSITCLEDPNKHFVIFVNLLLLNKYYDEKLKETLKLQDSQLKRLFAITDIFTETQIELFIAGKDYISKRP